MKNRARFLVTTLRTLLLSELATAPIWIILHSCRVLLNLTSRRHCFTWPWANRTD